MQRGDFLTIALPGDFGKPRPALVIQADSFKEMATVTVLLLSSSLIDAPLFRVTIEPSAQNGLQKISQIMIDKVMTVRKEKLGQAFGSASNEIMKEVNRKLALFLGIVD